MVIRTAECVRLAETLEHIVLRGNVVTGFQLVSEEEARRAMELSVRWARRCREYPLGEDQNLFGIIQGGLYENLRRESVEAMAEIPFEGYAIGGLSVGESKPLMYVMVEATEPLMPEDKPRYLMGVGKPEDLIEGVLRGMDLFDCVMPCAGSDGLLRWGQGRASPT